MASLDLTDDEEEVVKSSGEDFSGASLFKEIVEAGEEFEQSEGVLDFFKKTDSTPTEPAPGKKPVFHVFPPGTSINQARSLFLDAAVQYFIAEYYFHLNPSKKTKDFRDALFIRLKTFVNDSITELIVIGKLPQMIAMLPFNDESLSENLQTIYLNFIERDKSKHPISQKLLSQNYFKTAENFIINNTFKDGQISFNAVWLAYHLIALAAFIYQGQFGKLFASMDKLMEQWQNKPVAKGFKFVYSFLPDTFMSLPTPPPPFVTPFASKPPTATSAPPPKPPMATRAPPKPPMTTRPTPKPPMPTRPEVIYDKAFPQAPGPNAVNYGQLPTE